MQQCYLPPCLMREGETERRERLRPATCNQDEDDERRRRSECLCLAVMAYSQGRSDRPVSSSNLARSFSARDSLFLSISKQKEEKKKKKEKKLRKLRN